jgi:O-acetyl-ADP-ribose deacetylase (regulator of RNase III)
MKIQLIDRNEEMCDVWEEQFEHCPDITIYHGDFFSVPTDCVVSPANSFGFMDGGLDRVISEKLGWDIQRRLQTEIKENYNGELLVGQAILVRTYKDETPYCISAPTMRVPMILNNTVNVYLATKAVFNLLKMNPTIESVTMSGMGTGIGRVPYEICAKQMKQAYVEVWQGRYMFPDTWKESQDRHQLLYQNNVRDMQRL